MATSTKNTFKPSLENLEDRLVPTVTWHGGAVLPNVQTENIYLGSLWNTSGGRGMAQSLERFAGMIVKSRYMDVLNWAGYGVGRGTAYAGRILNYNLGRSISDGQIKWAIQQAIRSNVVLQPVRDNLFVVYVQPGVNVVASDGSSSAARSFTGYHSFFVGNDSRGFQRYVHYAVIAYPGFGVNPGPQLYGYRNQLDQLTDTASHEIAEAVTDPRNSGWYDGRYGMGGEIGDLTNSYHQYLGGFYVQLNANKNDRPIYLYNGILYRGNQAFRVSGLPYDSHETTHANAATKIATSVLDAYFAHSSAQAPQARLGRNLMIFH